MKEKILQFLKTKIGSHAGGIQENFLLGIADAYSKTITEESQIATTFTDGALESIKQSYTFVQAETDRKAKAELKAFRDKHGLGEDGLPLDKNKDKDKDKNKDKDKDKPDPDEPSWFKSYREKSEREIADLKAEQEGIKKAKTQENLLSKFNNHDKIKGKIPSSFLKGRNITVESEDKLDELVNQVESDYNAFKQEMAESGVVFSVPPAGGGSPKEGEAIGKALAEKRNTNASDGVKGKTV